ncbi:hypothetical protein KKA95_04815 [Patescibacteria group bacterium]|nr:hypothetical protein [Patescibacteria group bacterium]
MPPRQLLHPQNRITCDEGASFRQNVTNLIEGLRSIMREPMGQMCFVNLKDAVGNKRANFQELEMLLDVLTQHGSLQVEGVNDKTHHEMLIHMALSEFDQSYDGTRDH